MRKIRAETWRKFLSWSKNIWGIGFNFKCSRRIPACYSNSKTYYYYLKHAYPAFKRLPSSNCAMGRKKTWTNKKKIRRKLEFLPIVGHSVTQFREIDPIFICVKSVDDFTPNSPAPSIPTTCVNSKKKKNPKNSLCLLELEILLLLGKKNPIYFFFKKTSLSKKFLIVKTEIVRNSLRLSVKKCCRLVSNWTSAKFSNIAPCGAKRLAVFWILLKTHPP